MSRARTTTNHRRGILAEYMALLYLTLKGYRLVTMRYKTKLGEIDLIMRRGSTIAFIEVKARRTHEDAAHAIHAKNQARVMQAAQMFLASHPAYGNYHVRFDAVLIAWYKRPHHHVHAFGAH
jgi:putative endonuclease